MTNNYNAIKYIGYILAIGMMSRCYTYRMLLNGGIRIKFEKCSLDRLWSTRLGVVLNVN